MIPDGMASRICVSFFHKCNIVIRSPPPPPQSIWNCNVFKGFMATFILWFCPAFCIQSMNIRTYFLCPQNVNWSHCAFEWCPLICFEEDERVGLLVGGQKITRKFPKQKYLKVIRSWTLKFKKWEKSEQRRTTLQFASFTPPSVCRTWEIAIIQSPFYSTVDFVLFLLSCNHHLSWYSKLTVWWFYSSLCVGPQQISIKHYPHRDTGGGRSWLGHWATSRKVVGSVLDKVIRIFYLLNRLSL